MIDNIKVVFFTKHVKHFTDNICYYSKPIVATGEAMYYNTNYEGLYVTLVGNKVTISGSLHKFYHGNNYGLFKRSEIKETVEQFSSMFFIDPNSKEINITSLEYGVNVITKKEPLDYANCMLRYVNNKFRDCKPKRRTTKIWGRECSTTDFNLKFYDKTLQTELTSKKSPEDLAILKVLPKNILRYEIVHLRPKSMNYLYCLNSLHSIDFLNYLGEDLLVRFKKITKKNKLNCSLMKCLTMRKYFAGLSCEFWNELKKHPICSASYKKERAEFKRIETANLKTKNNLNVELKNSITVIIDYLKQN